VQNQHLTDIEASMQALVRRAYDMGRTDALNKIVDMMKADRQGSSPLAIEGPDEDASDMAHEDVNGMAPARAESPWWAWPVR
jgi:hypothetical protein